MFDIRRFKESTKPEMALTTSKKPVPISNFSNQAIELPKISSSQLEKAAKNLPSWLRTNSALKQLPAIYQGVLGQVQIAHYDFPGQAYVEYSNRLTDTERVYQLLLTSRLSHEVLATIWAHVNQTFPGKLINKELCFALALIALFQRKNIKDPFSAIRSERVPPLPNLYPQVVEGSNISEPLIEFLDDCSGDDQQFRSGAKKQSDNSNSNNIQTIKIATTNAFIHIEVPSVDHNVNEKINVFDATFPNPLIKNKIRHYNSSETIKLRNASGKITTSILDIDCKQMQLDEEFSMIARIWFRQMDAIKSVFKRTFDVLNVQHGRNNSLEALRTNEGANFIHNLAKCYPIAHRIRVKVSEFKLNSNYRTNHNFMHLIDNLMTSINESWAVLLNLFDEAGHGKFIETIMDELTCNESFTSKNGQFNEVTSQNITRERVCAICLTADKLMDQNDFKINGIESSTSELHSIYEDSLLTIDQHNYYHLSCGNFWLNQVEPTLPVVDHKIMSPIKPQPLHVNPES